MAWLANYLGFSEDEVAVYGDGGNDIVMLDAALSTPMLRAMVRMLPSARLATSFGNCAVHAVPRHMVATLRSRRNRIVIS